MGSDPLGARRRRAFRRAYAPDIHLIGGRNAFHKIDEPAVRRPGKVMTMAARFFRVNLPRVASIRVCDEDRVARSGSMPGYPAFVGGPGDFHRAGYEGVRRIAHDGSQPALIGSRAKALDKPEMRAITGKSQLSNRSRLQIPESALCNVYKFAAADMAYPHIKAAVPIGNERHELAVRRDRGVHFVAVEIGYALDLRIGEWITPEVIPLPQEPQFSRDQHSDGGRNRADDAAAPWRKLTGKMLLNGPA